MPLSRSAIAAKVQALLAKTMEAGATEAEALSAAEKARELMDRYNIEIGAAAMEAEGTTRYSTPGARAKRGYKGYQPKHQLTVWVGRFTDTKCWSSGDHIEIFGLKSDVDFAHWLLDSLSAFAVNQLAFWRLNQANIEIGQFFTPTPEEEVDFLRGVCRRINERLREQVLARADTSTGRALIPLKNQLVTRDFNKLGIRLRRTSSGPASNSDAFSAGRAAGDRASFGRPVSGTSARPLMIGGK